jgi:putative NADH-flavin reductase
MKLTILGATGGIGRILLAKALEQGHEVTAFVRAPEKIQIRSPRLSVIGGSLFNVQQMTDAIRGSEVVLSAFGPTTLRRTTLRCDFGRALVQALRSSAVDRLLHVSSALLFDDIGALGLVLRSTLFRNVTHDHVNSETELMQPDLAWTIVRPPRLVNHAATGRIRAEKAHLPKGGSTISRGDVASFLLQEAVAPRFIHQIVGISN